MEEVEDFLAGMDGEEEGKDESKDKSPEDKKFILRRELRQMMYGFGDQKVPYDKTVELLEAITLNYIKELCQLAQRVGKPDKLALEDIHYLIRRDTKKYARVKDLLSMSEELKKARKDFDEVKSNI